MAAPTATDPPGAVMVIRIEQHEVRRDEDDELLGFVSAGEDVPQWRALTVFGGVLGEHSDVEAARRQVNEIGLSSLAERWWADFGEGWEACSLVEASPERLVVVRGTFPHLSAPLALPPGTPIRLTPPPTPPTSTGSI